MAVTGGRGWWRRRFGGVGEGLGKKRGKMCVLCC